MVYNCLNDKYERPAFIKFNNGTKSISNKCELKELLNRHKSLNEYFCDKKFKDNYQTTICKYNYDKFNIFNTNKEAEIMINILYKSNSDICNNILEFYNLEKYPIDLDKVVEVCDEFKIDLINNYQNVIFNNINMLASKIIKFFSNWILLAIIIIQINNLFNYMFHVKKGISFDSILNEIKYNQSLDICSICHDSYEENINNICELKSCKHIYHYECIKTWIVVNKHNNCPLCNKHVLKIH